MKIDHIHFYVEDAISQRRWFAKYLGWSPVETIILPDRIVEILRYRHTPFVISSPRVDNSPVAEYLRYHPPGIADIAIEVDNLGTMDSWVKAKQHPTGSLATILAHLAELRHQPPTQWSRIEGWPGIQHTLVERQPQHHCNDRNSSDLQDDLQAIDHIALNVPTGQLQAAATFYQELFKLEKQQSFKIQTKQSGLRSQVLFSSTHQMYFNINEPASPTSQIQTFLDANRGAGIQHIALQSEPIVPTVTKLRQRGISPLPVPQTYYDQLQQRLQNYPKVPIHAEEWQQIMEQQILIDWPYHQPESWVLKISSQPIFRNNHFFIEFIERRPAIHGLDEANFLSLHGHTTAFK